MTLFLLLLSSLCFELCRAEIRHFNGTIEANSTVIHYSEGYLIAPATLDLSSLRFTTNDSKNAEAEATPGKNNKKLEVVFFHEPESCLKGKNGCNWTTLGIGASDDTGNTWCCTESAMTGGLCEEKALGHLIMETSFLGLHRFIDIPSGGKLDTKLEFGVLEEPEESGKYVLVLANCDDDGRDVLVEGDYIWKSKHGYLPGNFFGEMYFFIFLTVAYFILAALFICRMKLYEDAYIPIQKWILATIVLGLVEMFFRVGDYWVWNTDGKRFFFATYAGVFFGVVKGGLSRCLLVMVSLGWGVVRDKLDALYKIIFLGVVYVGMATAQDIMKRLYIIENQILSDHEEAELLDAAEALTFIMAAIDSIFLVWILCALDGTMQYLENMNQNRKLSRYLRLRCILLFSMLFSLMWMVFTLVNSYSPTGGISNQQYEWTSGAILEMNYLFILFVVAYLWRPNPNAKEFAHVMELPTLGEEDDDEHELQMTENVPSALDDSDDEDNTDIMGQNNH